MHALYMVDLFYGRGEIVFVVEAPEKTSLALMVLL